MSQRDEYVSRMKAQLDRWNADIDRWEAEYQRQLQSLRQHRDEAMVQLKLLQSAAGDAWTDVQRGADEAWDRMRQACEKAGGHFQKK
ncbi:MAG TPA: hypothetical protein VFC18_01495 [Burkholderiales bacterium]|nr:hypothetical protein [Burkholderiales bacterium]